MKIFKQYPGGNLSLKEAAYILYVDFDESKVTNRAVTPHDLTSSSIILYSIESNDISNRADGFGQWDNKGGRSIKQVSINCNVNGESKVVSLELRRSYWINNSNKEI